MNTFLTVLKVEGMSCPSCIRHIDQALKELDGVKGVEVQLKQGTVVVQHEGLEPRGMIAALEEAGYPSTVAAR